MSANPNDNAEPVAEVSRREALVRLAGAGFCACCAGLAGCQEQDEHPLEVKHTRYVPPPAGMQLLCRYSELQLNAPARYEIGQVTVYALRKQDEHGGEYALVLDSRCPHARCRVEYSSGDDTYRCPCHGSKFTEFGERISGPARRSLRSLYYEVRDGLVYADLGRELNEPAAPADAAAHSR
jgi:Rieske Fe-S protein